LISKYIDPKLLVIVLET